MVSAKKDDVFTAGSAEFAENPLDTSLSDLCDRGGFAFLQL